MKNKLNNDKFIKLRIILFILIFLFVVFCFINLILYYTYKNVVLPNSYIDELKISNYSYDKNEINYVKHIRNAVSHANLRFEPNEYVEFIDTNKYGNKNEKCIIRIPLVKICELLEYLQGIFYRYIGALKLNLF